MDEPPICSYCDTVCMLDDLFLRCFKIDVCSRCKQNRPDDFEMVLKTAAKNDWLLTERDMEGLGRMCSDLPLCDRPHNFEMAPKNDWLLTERDMELCPRIFVHGFIEREAKKTSQPKKRKMNSTYKLYLLSQVREKSMAKHGSMEKLKEAKEAKELKAFERRTAPKKSKLMRIEVSDEALSAAAKQVEEDEKEAHTHKFVDAGENPETGNTIEKCECGVENEVEDF